MQAVNSGRPAHNVCMREVARQTRMPVFQSHPSASRGTGLLMGWFLHEAGDAFEHLPADAVPKGAPLDPAVIGLGCRRFRREQDDAIVRLRRQKVFGNLDGLDQPIVGADEMIGWKQDDDRVWIAVKNVREGQEHAKGGPAAAG